MNPILFYLQRQRRVIWSYRFVELIADFIGISFLFFQIVLIIDLLAPMFKGSFFVISFYGSVALLISFFSWFFFRYARKFLSRITLDVVADLVEKQGFSSSEESRGELRAIGWYLENPSNDIETAHLLHLHRRRWTSRLRSLPLFLRPSPFYFLKLAANIFVVVAVLVFSQVRQASIPGAGFAWMPGSYEIKYPYDGAAWKVEQGALSGIKGSRARFVAPQFDFFQTYIFFISHSGRSTAISCRENCEIALNEGGRYAIGSMLKRSAFFPLQVQEDQPPRGVLLAEVQGEFAASAIIQLQNISGLKLRALASDDIRLESVELVHSFGSESKNPVEEILMSKNIQDEAWKQDFDIPISGWKGGEHHLFIRVRDQRTQIESPFLTVLYADEETIKAKLALSLRSLIDEWVHVLGDLLESEHRQKVVEGLSRRLDSISYEIEGGAPMIQAYARELKLLSTRIQKWIRLSPSLEQLPDLIKRTERQILYGLSLLFQEKTGDIQATQQSLSEAKADLTKLLERIKDGKLDPSSEELQKAFDSLAKKLEELQTKIKELPSGPQDELLNRQALESQLQESQSLADRIEEIKKQIASGDSKGAMRELESLLNQLSILTKEMESSLEQWQENVDRGSVQASQKYAKALEDLIKKQEKLMTETQTLKNKYEKLKEESSKKWESEDPKKAEQMQKAFDEKEGVQKEISEHFQKAREAFDQQVSGGEWKELLRSEDVTSSEDQAAENMIQSAGALHERRAFDSIAHQKDVLERLKQSQKNQKDIQQQLKSLAQSQGSSGSKNSEKIETIVTEGKAEKERRRKIMDSLQQNVGQEFQKSHEKYFEDLLQR